MDAGAGVGAAIGSGVGADTESIDVGIGPSMPAVETSGKGRSCRTRLPEEKGKKL